MSAFWNGWQRKHEARLAAAGMHPLMARLLASLEAKARAQAEQHVGRAVALAATFEPGEAPGTGRLWIDSHKVPPEQRAAAKAGLGLPSDY